MDRAGLAIAISVMESVELLFERQRPLSAIKKANGKAFLLFSRLLRTTDGHPSPNNRGKLQLHEPRVLDSCSQKTKVLSSAAWGVM